MPALLVRPAGSAGLVKGRYVYTCAAHLWSSRGPLDPARMKGVHPPYVRPLRVDQALRRARCHQRRRPFAHVSCDGLPPSNRYVTYLNRHADPSERPIGQGTTNQWSGGTVARHRHRRQNLHPSPSKAYPYPKLLWMGVFDVCERPPIPHLKSYLDGLPRPRPHTVTELLP